MKRTLSRLVAGLGLVLIGEPVAGSPSAAKHVEQTFLGANATQWYYFEFIRDFPASYYEHTEILRVCSRRKSDGALVDSTIVSQVRHHRDPSSLQPLPNESKPTGAFDLTAYMRQHDIHLGMEAGSDQTALVDSVGFYMQGRLERISFITSSEMSRQMSRWAKHEPAVVRGSNTVSDPWNRDAEGKPRAEERYFVVDFGRPGSESSWGRYVIYAHRRLPAKK